MKFNIIYAILFCCILTTLNSCNGQKHPESSMASEKTVSPVKTVSEFDGGIMIVFQDKKNTFWFAGNGKGVYRLKDNKFEKFKP